MIVFRNNGLIDPASITTFGVSSKENPGAIGFFGTGLKYAIAILLREGCPITIFTGGERLEFGQERARVRVDEFTFVTMNGERLGFTTELGKGWELWCALRELYCNCMDEGGTVEEVPEGSEVDVKDGETVVVVGGQKFKDVWDRRREVFLSTEPLYRHESVHIHPGSSPFIYYRGIRAYQPSSPTRFTYNIQRKTDLTEDRTIKYVWDVNAALNNGVTECEDTRILRDILTAPKGTFEASHDWSGIPGTQFLSVVRELARGFDRRLNSTALELCRPYLLEDLHDVKAAPLNPVEQKRLDKAIGFCERIGFPVSSYPIVATDFLGEDVLGRAHNNRIYVSKRVFMMGTKMLAGTLIEEFIHLRHRLFDESRPLQNFLVDAVVSLGEQLTGEPL